MNRHHSWQPPGSYDEPDNSDQLDGNGWVWSLLGMAALVVVAFMAGCGSGVYPGQDAIEDGMASPAQCCYPQPCECPRLPG